MSALHSPRLHRPDSSPSMPTRRRAIWHQRLIDAEGGTRLALRANSTLYVHLFAASVVGATGAVLGFTFHEWLFILAAFTVTLAAETYNLALRALVDELPSDARVAIRRAQRLSTAATLIVVVGAALISAGIVGRHLWLMFE